MEALDELCRINRSHFHCLEKLSLLYAPSKSLIENQLPSTVTVLKVVARDPKISFPLSLLPPCLTEFDCIVDSLTIGASKFPESLKSLDLSWHGDDSRSWPIVFHILPPEITKIAISETVYCYPKGEDWTALSALSSLKSFSMDVHGQFMFEQAQKIPRSVESLDLRKIKSGITESWCIDILRGLPPNLTALDGIWPDDITPEVVQHMPRGLIQTDKHIPPKAVSFLPESICELQISQGDVSVISTFPSRLLTLKLPDITLELVEKLPIRLEYLGIRKVSFTLTADLVEKLPRTLLKLHAIRSYQPLREVEEVFKALPPTLTVLRAYPFFPDKDIRTVAAPSISSQYIPRCMRDLRLGFLDFFGEKLSEWILGLPTSLTTLKIGVNYLQVGWFASISNLHFLKSLEITVVNSFDGQWSQFLHFPSFPRSLKILDFSALDFTHDHTSDISNDSFIGAPPSLTEIRLPHSPLITRDCLDHLPALSFLCCYPSRSQPEWFRNRNVKLK
jgi:hypothetical protein